MTTFVNCLVLGVSFSPKKFEELSGLKLISKCEKGDIGEIGRFKGKIMPYGSAEIEIESINGSELDFILILISQNYTYLKESGMDEIYVTLNVGYKDQCNLDFNNKQLKMIVDLDIKFSISCYEVAD